MSEYVLQIFLQFNNLTDTFTVREKKTQFDIENKDYRTLVEKTTHKISLFDSFRQCALNDSLNTHF